MTTAKQTKYENDETSELKRRLKIMGLKVSGTRAQCIERLERSQDVMSYRGRLYYRCTLPNRALNRTRDGYNLFRVENGVHILEAIE